MNDALVILVLGVVVYLVGGLVVNMIRYAVIGRKIKKLKKK
jgi:hypothetical protein